MALRPRGAVGELAAERPAPQRAPSPFLCWVVVGAVLRLPSADAFAGLLLPLCRSRAVAAAISHCCRRLFVFVPFEGRLHFATRRADADKERIERFWDADASIKGTRRLSQHPPRQNKVSGHRLIGMRSIGTFVVSIATSALGIGITITISSTLKLSSIMSNCVASEDPNAKVVKIVTG